MRIIQVVEATAGGVARHVVDLCLGLTSIGIELHILASDKRMDETWRAGLSLLKEAGVRLVSLPLFRAPHPSDIGALLFLLKHMKNRGPFDLIHGHSSKAGGIIRLAKNFAGIPTVYTPHAFVTLSLNPFNKAVYGLIERMLVTFTDGVIAVSEREYFEALRLGFPREKVRIIPNGISLQSPPREAREAIRKSWGIRAEATVIGYVGRFDRQKNPSLLLEAFGRITYRYPNTYLVMVGAGPLLDEVKGRAKLLGILDKVVFPGFLPGRKVIHAFDIFALSSDFEGFPYVLLEAMAEGLPIVATKVGGTEMVLEHGKNGFVVPIREVTAFAESLEILLRRPDLRRMFGLRSLERVHEFTVSKMVEETLAFYTELLGKKRRGR